jgi:hypothetical protein
MSYIGNQPTTAAFPFDQFSGNGTTTAFTLTYAPAGPTSIIVSISGVVQNPNLYSVIGTTITFSPAPPSGTNNIAVLYLGLPVITPAGTGDFTTINDSGNLNFTGTGNRITGDFSNATIANRVMFQSSTVNGNTSIFAIPNGTASSSVFHTANSSDPANSSLTSINCATSESQILATRTGTGTYLPMTFYTGGSERMRVATDGATLVGQNMSAQFPTQLAIADSTHATSRRAAISVGSGWLVLQDSTGDGTKDFSIYDGTAAAQRFRIDTSGNLQFNSGYGYVATAYGCRAWVNFNGTGANGTNQTIRGSGNVSSVSKTSSGVYVMNFATAMPDVNYAALGTAMAGSATAAPLNDTIGAYSFNTGSLGFQSTDGTSNTYSNPVFASLAVFR